MDAPAFLFGVPQYVVRQLIEEGLRAALTALTWRREQCFGALWMFALNWGRLLEGREMRKQGHG